MLPLKVSAARPGIPGPARKAELSCPTVPSACGHVAITCLPAAPASPLHGDRSASLSSRGKTASTAGPSHPARFAVAPSVHLTSLWGPQPPEGGDGAFSRALDQAHHTRDGENRLWVLVFAVVCAVEVGAAAVTPPCVPVNQNSALTVLFF